MDVLLRNMVRYKHLQLGHVYQRSEVYVNMDHVNYQNKDNIAKREGHKVALDCLIKGINAAHPRKRINETVSRQNGELTIESVDGTQALYNLKEYNKIFIIGGGNAAGHAATVLENKLGDRLSSGAVVTDNIVEADDIEMLSGGHPEPTKEAIQHTESVLDIAAKADEDDLVIVVITGGASALLSAPHEQLSLSELQKTTDALLSSGASIDEINAIRKHCSQIKGGRLVQKITPATTVTLALSDVIGDELTVIGSGPTYPDSTTYAEALAVVERYNIEIPDSVQNFLNAGKKGIYSETPISDAGIFDQAESYIIANSWNSVNAAKRAAKKHGYKQLILSTRIRGEAREAGLTHLAVAEECAKTGIPVSPPCVILSSGETTVSLCSNPGRGGPNQEFVASAAAELDDQNIVIASVDTDGIDGATNVAGAIADANTFSNADPNTALDQNDVFPVLEEEGGLIRTGPTGTNVNDLRAVVIT